METNMLIMDISRSQDSDENFNQGFEFNKDLEEYPVSRLNELSYEELVNYLYSFTKEELIRMLYYHIDKKEDDTNRTGLTVSVSEQIRNNRESDDVESKEKISDIIQSAESNKSKKEDKPSIEDLIDEAEESESEIDEENNQILEEEKIDYDKIGSVEDRKDTSGENMNNVEDSVLEEKQKTNDETNSNIEDDKDTGSQSTDDGQASKKSENIENEKIDYKNNIIPKELDLNKDKKVLLNCLSKNNLKYKLLLNIIQDNNINNLLLIRYNQISEQKLIDLSEKLENIKLITIGFDQKVPKTVDKININNPGDVRRMGILATDKIKSMNGKTIITYDSLDILTQYISIKSAFKFLHIFLGKLSQSNSTILLSVNSSAIDATKVNTVKPLFDRVLDIDKDKVSAEN